MLNYLLYKSMADVNATHLSDLFVYVADQVPIFIPMLLLSIYFIVFLGTYFGQRKISYNTDPFSSLAVAGFVTFVISLLLSLIPNLMNPFYVLICFVLAIVGLVLLSLNND